MGRIERVVLEVSVRWHARTLDAADAGPAAVGLLYWRLVGLSRASSTLPDDSILQ